MQLSSTEMDKTLYEILNVSETASLDEIKAAFKRLAKIYHPDVTNLPKKEAGEKFKTILNAYTTLSNQTDRLLYDQSLRYGAFRKETHPRYVWKYLSYLDGYGWTREYPGEWNEHHDMMYS